MSTCRCVHQYQFWHISRRVLYVASLAIDASIVSSTPYLPSGAPPGLGKSTPAPTQCRLQAFKCLFVMEACSMSCKTKMRGLLSGWHHYKQWDDKKKPL